MEMDYPGWGGSGGGGAGPKIPTEVPTSRVSKLAALLTLDVSLRSREQTEGFSSFLSFSRASGRLLFHRLVSRRLVSPLLVSRHLLSLRLVSRRLLSHRLLSCPLISSRLQQLFS